MKLQGLGGFKNLNELVLSKINAFAQRPTEFSRLFDLMFSERENVLAETTSGYRIKEITYGETRANVFRLANALEGVFADYEKDSFIGLSMANGVEWIECFWAIMMAGYKPVLLNTRLPMAVLEETLATYGVKAVVSDSATYTACPTYLRKDVDVTDCDRAEESFTFGTEVIFMSSGTQGAVKLCAYTAKQFYYQICDTYYIIKECPQIRKGYEGKIKQLALLPFYHVFGFMAVYLWFGFFSRTFVFLKEDYEASEAVDVYIMAVNEEEKLKATFAKDTIKTQDEALIEIYKKLRPGELPTADAARNLFSGLLFDPRRYDLARVGRYKFNQKLSLATRITNQVAFADIINPETGEVLVEKDATISAEVAKEIQNSGINIVDVKVNDRKVRIIGKFIIIYLTSSSAQVYPDRMQAESEPIWQQRQATGTSE